MFSSVYISVIVPVYNVANCLPRCIDSILSQTFSEFELLLVDDGSTDKSGDICDIYAKKDPRIRVFHKMNGGVSSARQLGIEKAQGYYSIQFDSDDWIEPDTLAEMYVTITESGADIAIASGIYYEKESESRYEIRQFMVEPTPKKIICAMLTRKLFVGMVNKLICHHLYADYNIDFPVTIDYGEDCYVLCKLLLQTRRIVFVDKTFYHYCYNPDSITGFRFQHKHFAARFWWISQLEISFQNDMELNEALMCMKVFVKQDAYCSGLYSQAEFNAIYPEAVTYINRTPLYLHDRLLLSLACRGKAKLARHIRESYGVRKILNLLRLIKIGLAKMKCRVKNKIQYDKY